MAQQRNITRVTQDKIEAYLELLMKILRLDRWLYANGFSMNWPLKIEQKVEQKNSDWTDESCQHVKPVVNF